MMMKLKATLSGAVLALGLAVPVVAQEATTEAAVTAPSFAAAR